MISSFELEYQSVHIVSFLFLVLFSWILGWSSLSPVIGAYHLFVAFGLVLRIVVPKQQCPPTRSTGLALSGRLDASFSQSYTSCNRSSITCSLCSLKVVGERRMLSARS